jgi:hypothetical protein
MTSFIICIVNPRYYRPIKSRRKRWERRGKRTGFWQEGPKERDHLKDQGVNGRIGSEWILGRMAGV